jgi:hypothetical protein
MLLRSIYRWRKRCLPSFSDVCLARKQGFYFQKQMFSKNSLVRHERVQGWEDWDEDGLIDLEDDAEIVSEEEDLMDSQEVLLLKCVHCKSTVSMEAMSVSLISDGKACASRAIRTDAARDTSRYATNSLCETSLTVMPPTFCCLNVFL